MSKLTEFRPSDEASLVSRLLILVHKAIDESFPEAEPASRRFAKTVFSSGDEPTINQVLPQEVLNTDTLENRKNEGDQLLTPMQRLKSKVRRFIEVPRNQIYLTITGILALFFLLYFLIF